MMKTKFDEQLEEMHVELIKMGSLCEQAITLSSRALLGDEKRDASEVISLGKTIYYGSALIATMFVIRTIPAQYTDEAILSALTRNLYLAVAVTEVLSFILSKLFRRKLDALFERYFIMIITATFLFILLLVVLY